MAERGKVHIRRRDTRESVYAIAVSDRVSPGDFDKWIWRLNRATDQEQFYVDDTEIEWPT